MQSQGKRLLWSPTPSSDRFVVYGGTDARLHEWNPRSRSSRTLASLTDLPPFRSLAWSPHSQSDDLVAIGLATGRTLLLRLQDPASHQPASPTTVPYHSSSLPIRQQRPVNAVAFSPSDPNLLAVGLEKARDYAVHVWDIERSVRLLDAHIEESGGLDGRRESPYRPGARISETRTASSPAPEQRAFATMGTSEGVASTTFLHAGSNTSAQLVVGYSSRSIRSFDIRERLPMAGGVAYGGGTSTASGIYQTRAVNGLCGDPFDGHRFASWDSEGIIKIWDSRRNTEAILTFSEGDSGLASLPPASALGTSSPSRRSNGILGIAFNPLRRGILGTMEVNATSVHLWNILAGAESWGKESHIHDDRETSEDPFVPAILASSALTSPFTRAPTSFAFAGITSSSVAQSVCSVSREGHVEFLDHRDPTCTAWNAEGEYAVLSGLHLRIIDGQAKTADIIPPPLPPASTAEIKRPSFLRQSSMLSYETGQRTPRPALARKHTSLQSEDMRTVADKLEHLRDSEEVEDPAGAVASDISTVMRTRVPLGYAAEASRNVKLTTEKLSDFWGWIANAEQMANKGRALVDKHDFSFAGALSLLRGFPSILASSASSSNSTKSAASTYLSTFAVPSTSETAHDDRTRQSRRTINMGNPANENRAADAAYTAATRQVNDLNGVTAFVKASGEKLLPRRRLALALLGPDLASDDPTAIVKGYEKEGLAERAAAWAVYNGDAEEAIKSLRRGKDERLKLLAPTLATYVTQLRKNTSSDPVFNELCNSLSADLPDPFLRSIFAFLASGQVSDILDEEALPLRDRMGVALRFLRDDELLKYLDGLATSLVAQGDLEGIAVTGLTGQGLQLLQTYVDRTGDVQTAALAASYVHPGKIFDARAERWIMTYRSLLDTWRLYVPRARFDVARGNRLRTTRALLTGAGATMDPYEIAPARLLIRCHYCNRTVAPTGSARPPPPPPHQKLNSFPTTSPSPTSLDPSPTPQSERSGGPVGGVNSQLRGMRVKTTTCPSCHRGLSRCAICLERMSVPDQAEDAEPPMAWSWCQRCRHGGHALHLSDWFRSHVRCSVAGCDCECMSV